MTMIAPLGQECAQAIISADWNVLFCSRPIGHDDSHEAVFFENMVEAQPCHKCKKPVRWHKNYIKDLFSCWDHLEKGWGNGQNKEDQAQIT